MVRWDGRSWQGRFGEVNGRRLWAVWGSALDDVWAVGEGGAMARWDGRAVTALASPVTEDLFAVGGSSKTDVWVGTSDALLHFDGQHWQTHDLPEALEVRSIWASARDDVWAFGNAPEGEVSTVLHFDGSTWKSRALPSPALVRDVWGASRDDVWAVGSRGKLFRWDGGAWTQQPSPVTHELHSVWGSAADDVWAAGDARGVLHFDGASWTFRATPGNDFSLGDQVWGLRRNDVWVQGRTQHHWDGKRWEQHGVDWNHTFNDIWANGASDVWAVGSEGKVLRSDGKTWRDVPSPTKEELWSVWAADPQHLWAVGSRGTVLSWNGKIFSSTKLGDETWRRVWGTSAKDVWIVGDLGSIGHYDGQAWHVESNVRADLYGLWGTAPDDVWAVGSSEQLKHFDGKKWTTHPSPIASATYSDVRGLSKNDVWVTGVASSKRFLLHWDGAHWQRHPSPLDVSLQRAQLIEFWRGDAKQLWLDARGELARWDGKSWLNGNLGWSDSSAGFLLENGEGYAAGLRGIVHGPSQRIEPSGPLPDENAEEKAFLADVNAPRPDPQPSAALLNPPPVATVELDGTPASSRAEPTTEPGEAPGCPDYARALARGRGAVKAGDFDAAIDAFVDAARARPFDATAAIERGVARHLAGDPAAALPDLAFGQRVTTTPSLLARAWLQLALVFHDLSRPEHERLALAVAQHHGSLPAKTRLAALDHPSACPALVDQRPSTETPVVKGFETLATKRELACAAPEPMPATTPHAVARFLTCRACDYFDRQWSADLCPKRGPFSIASQAALCSSLSFNVVPLGQDWYWYENGSTKDTPPLQRAGDYLLELTRGSNLAAPAAGIVNRGDWLDAGDTPRWRAPDAESDADAGAGCQPTLHAEVEHSLLHGTSFGCADSNGTAPPEAGPRQLAVYSLTNGQRLFQLSVYAGTVTASVSAGKVELRGEGCDATYTLAP
jgi:hypothetical protein